jgi:hypothetical protein
VVRSLFIISLVYVEITKLIQEMSEIQPSSKMDKVSGVVGIMGMSYVSCFTDGSWENDGKRN